MACSAGGRTALPQTLIALPQTRAPPPAVALSYSPALAYEALPRHEVSTAASAFCSSPAAFFGNAVPQLLLHQSRCRQYQNRAMVLPVLLCHAFCPAPLLPGWLAG
eukprot:262564-Rhodomonas_salina.7